MTHELINQVFAEAFDGLGLQSDLDAAVLDIDGGRLAFTTDSFVVDPLFFPGGDIGKLSVCGTINDLATAGARPICLSVAFILEEGFPLEDLWRIALSIRDTALEAGVSIVTGDTKVVNRRNGDGVFVTTTGIGMIEHPLDLSPDSIRVGDAVLINGDLGRHGMAVMAMREGLGFTSTIDSDCAPLSDLVLNLLEAGIQVRCIRDLTRGGLASAANEIAMTARVTIALNEIDIPVREDVRAACEILGLDPLYVANEGRLLMIVPQEEAALALETMRSTIDGTGSCQIGHVSTESHLHVRIRSLLGVDRVLDMMTGEQLPRIC